MEIRSLTSEIRSKGRTISGYAIVFNQLSHYLYIQGRKCKEIILPEAIDDNLINRSDVLALIDHDKSRLVARSYFGKGTLKLSIDEHGLFFRFEAPDTADGQYLIEMIKRGDISKCSFSFAEGAGRWEKRNGIDVRVVTKLSGLFDVSVVTRPAYEGTSVDVRKNGRGRFEHLHKELDEGEKRSEARYQESRERAAREIELRQLEQKAREAEAAKFNEEIEEKKEKLKRYGKRYF